jgi:hypothetical protein
VCCFKNLGGTFANPKREDGHLIFMPNREISVSVPDHLFLHNNMQEVCAKATPTNNLTNRMTTLGKYFLLGPVTKPLVTWTVRCTKVNQVVLALNRVNDVLVGQENNKKIERLFAVFTSSWSA